MPIRENKSDTADTDKKPEEKKEKTIYYVTDAKQQGQYIGMFKAAGMDAMILDQNIDQPFISQLEAKNEGIKFKRIDADVSEALRTKTSKKADKEFESHAEEIKNVMKKYIKKDDVTIKVEKLKNKKIASMVTLSEETRRMQDMMKMYASQGLDMGPQKKEGMTLILNAGHPLVQYILDHKEGANTEMICEQLYDLGMLQQAPLEPDEMARFVTRTNDIMMMLAGDKE
jgi:molecular chaperone HtpG